MASTNPRAVVGIVMVSRGGTVAWGGPSEQKPRTCLRGKVLALLGCVLGRMNVSVLMAVPATPRLRHEWRMRFSVRA